MAGSVPRTVPYRRAREGKTNYRRRIKLLASQQPRLVFRRSNRRIIGQVVSFGITGDRIAAGTDSFALRRHGWTYSGNSLPAAYLTGYLTGRLALQRKLSKAVLDLGWRTTGRKGRAGAFLKGALDAGLQVPHHGEFLPEEQRVQGEHLKAAKEMATTIRRVKESIDAKAGSKDITDITTERKEESKRINGKTKMTGGTSHTPTS